MVKKILTNIKEWIKETNLKIERSFEAKDMTREEWKIKHRASRAAKILIDGMARK